MFFVSGTKITIFLAFFTIILGFLLGVILALMKLSKYFPLKAMANSYIEFIRGTPLLIQLFIIYYGLPGIGIKIPEFPALGNNFSDFLAGVIALSINSASYVAEIIRAGIQSVDSGQMEASKALGMPYWLAMRTIILPQAFRKILPALGNEFIVIIKESAIVSVIGIHDLMYNADTVRGNTFQPFEPLIIVAIIYFIITFTLSKLLGIFERKLAKYN